MNLGVDRTRGRDWCRDRARGRDWHRTRGHHLCLIGTIFLLKLKILARNINPIFYNFIAKKSWNNLCCRIAFKLNLNFQSRSAQIKGFVWTNTNEVAFVTDHGIEFYQVISVKEQHLANPFCLYIYTV